jgi:Bacterial protein of unknown function (DUF924)
VTPLASTESLSFEIPLRPRVFATTNLTTTKYISTQARTLLTMSSAAAASTSTTTAASAAELEDVRTRVIDYWFPGYSDDADAHELTKKIAGKWFKGGPEIDATIIEKFANDVARAERGEYDALCTHEDPMYRLTYIILNDQFRRNIFRKKPESFAMDPKVCQCL